MAAEVACQSLALVGNVATHALVRTWCVGRQLSAFDRHVPLNQFDVSRTVH